MMDVVLGSVDANIIKNGITTKDADMTTDETVDNKCEDFKKENETTDSLDRVCRDIDGKLIDMEEIMWRT